MPSAARLGEAAVSTTSAAALLGSISSENRGDSEDRPVKCQMEDRVIQERMLDLQAKVFEASRVAANCQVAIEKHNQLMAERSAIQQYLDEQGREAERLREKVEKY